MIRRDIILAVLFGCATISAVAQSQREHILIDQDWRFAFGNASDPLKDFNFSIAPAFSKNGKAEGTAIDPKFNDDDWRSLDLPHDWAVELPFVKSGNFDVMAHGYKPVGGLFPETSIGWYRKTFEVHAADSGKRFSLQFDGIFRSSMVWLNGFYVGKNESGYVGQTYDVTDYVNFQGRNVIVVRVDASHYEGWFYEGAGIYRHVWLNKYDNTHIGDDTFVRSVIQPHEATVDISVPVENDSYAVALTELTVTILDRSGKVVASSKALPVESGPTSRLVVPVTVQLRDARLWSIEEPYLYKARVILKTREQIIDERVIRFGIRDLVISPGKGVLLNGVPVKIKGVNCHQDHAGVGSALPDYLQYYRIRLLKEMGVNAYRSSHHAPTPELLDACDSLGMLVMDEARLLSSSDEYLDQFRRLILRDRNHPSVFMWSIGNEEGYLQTQGTGKRVALTMMHFQRQLDPTRTCTYAADLPNVFRGVNEVIPVRGFNYREKFVIPYHLDHPQQPIVGTEMGSTVTTRGIYEIDSVRAYVPDQDIVAPWWASTAEAWWPIAATNDWFMGGFIWTGFDYRGEPTPFQWPNINSHFGVMDMCGFPKNIYYYYQSWWADKDVLHISPHWNWSGDEGKVKQVWVNSNANEVELFLNGKSLGRRKMPRNSHLKWDVPYRKGKMEAVGYRGGKTFRKIIETTGQAYGIVLTADRSQLRADGRDAVVVNVHAVDKKGRAVPDAANEISFNLTGQGRILGGGNGDPSSHEMDKGTQTSYTRKLFNGKCQIILQSVEQDGRMVLKATSPDLQNAEVDVAVKK